MTFDEELMKRALKRINELQQETIEKSKKVPNSEAIVKVRMKEFYRTYGEQYDKSIKELYL